MIAKLMDGKKWTVDKDKDSDGNGPLFLVSGCCANCQLQNRIQTAAQLHGYGMLTCRSWKHKGEQPKHEPSLIYAANGPDAFHVE
jgi:hypothetical protein